MGEPMLQRHVRTPYRAIASMAPDWARRHALSAVIVAGALTGCAAPVRLHYVSFVGSGQRHYLVEAGDIRDERARSAITHDEPPAAELSPYAIALSGTPGGEWAIVWSNGACTIHQREGDKLALTRHVRHDERVCGAAWSGDGRLAIAVRLPHGLRVELHGQHGAVEGSAAIDWPWPDGAATQLIALSWSADDARLLASTATFPVSRRRSGERMCVMLSRSTGQVIGRWPWSDAFFVGTHALVARTESGAVQRVRFDADTDADTIGIADRQSLDLPYPPEGSIPALGVFIHRAPMGSSLADPKTARGHVVLVDAEQGRARRISRDFFLVEPVGVLPRPGGK
jgi:hypothetical protein